MKLKVGIACASLLLVCFFLYSKNTQPPANQPALVSQAQDHNSGLLTLEQVKSIALSRDSQKESATSAAERNSRQENIKTEPLGEKLLDSEVSAEHPGYEIEDGVAVVEGDMVLGEPSLGQKYQGFNQPLILWPNGVVPFFIQGDVQNPERIIRAIAAFADSGISFVPYSNQEDVLVFQNGTGNCKSYVGKVGGKQPLWVAPGCGSKELIHEIMHALGFIHE
jgi:hypothetical protein